MPPPSDMLARARLRVPVLSSVARGRGATLPEPRTVHYSGRPPFPFTGVRACADSRRLLVVFRCSLAADTRLAGAQPQAPMDDMEHVWLELAPCNDFSSWRRFRVDWRGSREHTALQRMPGECSLGAVPDLWERRLPAGPSEAWTVHHGVGAREWWAELEIPWACLGLDAVPPVLGANYGRVFRRGAQEPQLAARSWLSREAWDRGLLLDHGEWLVGADADAPDRLVLGTPGFGENEAQLHMPRARPGRRLLVRTVAGDGRVLAEAPFPAGGKRVPFRFCLDRRESSHADVFAPQRLELELWSRDDRLLYRARLPADRHLGLCVDEPYGDAKSTPASRSLRDRRLHRVVQRLPRLERCNTQQGAASDFCLRAGATGPEFDLMDNGAWARLAGLVESCFAVREDRLLGAMALIAQKTVANLLLTPMFFDGEGSPTYGAMPEDMMGPLSILRYGGGPPVALAAALARLLQHVTDPLTGKPFLTRVVSLTRSGGPRQTRRRYVKPPALNRFRQEPGLVACVAVDYGESQTLLDPASLVFFARRDGTLAAIEELPGNEALLRAGAGRLADFFRGLDVEEVRRPPRDRLLSRGVFPELCPDEDGAGRDFDPRLQLEFPTAAVAPGAAPAVLAGFRDEFGRQGRRDATVRLERIGTTLRVRVDVTGVTLSSLGRRDLEVETVHLAVDAENDHFHVLHFAAGLDGQRAAWREVCGGIQTACKHLCTPQHVEDGPLTDVAWSARSRGLANGYRVAFDVALPGPAPQLPPVIGFNVWIDARAPEYEQVFLCPPRRALGPMDPSSFAKLTLLPTPLRVQALELGVPRWGRNTAQAVVLNRSDRPRRVRVIAENRLGMRRHLTRLRGAWTTVPAGGRSRVRFRYSLDPEEKMGTAPQELILRAESDDPAEEFFRGAWRMTYCSVPGVASRYGGRRAAADPAPDTPDYAEQKARYICSLIPEFERLTTLQGASSDFFLRAADGSAEFDLMRTGVLDEIAGYIRGLFRDETDRILGMFFLAQHPAFVRHMSWGHRLLNGAGPLSVIRANFAGAGGNCGYRARAFAGMLSHLPSSGAPYAAHSQSVWGHVVTCFDLDGDKAVLDADVGHFFLSAKTGRIATLRDWTGGGRILTTAGPGELARYMTLCPAAARDRVAEQDGDWHGVFPIGAPGA